MPRFVHDSVHWRWCLSWPLAQWHMCRQQTLLTRSLYASAEGPMQWWQMKPDLTRRAFIFIFIFQGMCDFEVTQRLAHSGPAAEYATVPEWHGWYLPKCQPVPKWCRRTLYSVSDHKKVINPYIVHRIWYGYTSHLVYENCESNRVKCFTEVNRKHTDECLRGQHCGHGVEQCD